MSQTVPPNPKIYHITHVNNLPDIINNGGLFSDNYIRNNLNPQVIGYPHIKNRRLTLPIASHPGLFVGHCVPFYFCPRSVMLYLISQKSAQLCYQGGQSQIVHLEADLHDVVNWSVQNNRRWAFTLENAGSYIFRDRSSLTDLKDLDWQAIQSTSWAGCREKKQAEFLVETSVPFTLFDKIGVHNQNIANQVQGLFNGHQTPTVQIRPTWYY